MSKNTRSAEFRKVDVDELDDEQYQDDPEEIADSDDCKVQQREQEIKKLMQSYPSFEKRHGACLYGLIIFVITVFP